MKINRLNNEIFIINDIYKNEFINNCLYLSTQLDLTQYEDFIDHLIQYNIFNEKCKIIFRFDLQKPDPLSNISIILFISKLREKIPFIPITINTSLFCDKEYWYSYLEQEYLCETKIHILNNVHLNHKGDLIKYLSHCTVKLYNNINNFDFNLLKLYLQHPSIKLEVPTEDYTFYIKNNFNVVKKNFLIKI